MSQTWKIAIVIPEKILENTAKHLGFTTLVNCPPSALSAGISRHFCLKTSARGRHFGVISRVTFPFLFPSCASIMEISHKVSKQDFFFPFPEHCSEGTCMLCGLRAFVPPLAPFWGGWDPTCTWLLQPHWRCSVVKASRLKPSFTDTSSAGLTCFHCLEHWKAT